MNIYIESKKKKMKIKFEGTVIELLDKLGVRSNEVLVTRSGTLLIENDILCDADEIQILSVVSGG